MNRKILIVFVITLFLDQISKALVSSMMSLGHSIKIINNFFYITYLNNYGAAWSMFTDKNTFLIILSIVALIIMYRFIYVFEKNKRNTFAFGLVMAGIMGNLIDRWLFGYVRDFIKLNFVDFYLKIICSVIFFQNQFTYRSVYYPVFNIADIAVVVGVLLILIAIFKGEDKSGKNSSTR